MECNFLESYKKCYKYVNTSANYIRVLNEIRKSRERKTF